MADSHHFPPITYGRDSYHGRSGPEYDDPGDGFAENRSYEGSGYELKLFRGVWLDHLSIQEIEDDEAAEQSVIENESDKEFLAKCGFGSDGTTLQ